MNRCCSQSCLLAVLLGLIALPLSAAQPSHGHYVIIHADDAGMSHSANRATIDAMEHGVVSSASIMVPCPWFPEIARYAKSHPDKDFGIHLTLNCEWHDYRWGPVTPRDQVPSLVDPDGYLWSRVADVVTHAKAAEVETELRAQIERARRFGVPITHLDTHMGAVVSRPDLAEIYVKLGLDYKLPILFVRPAPGSELAKRYPEIIKLAPRLEQQGLPILSAIFQSYKQGEFAQRKAAYLDTLSNLPAGVSQIIIHCGYNDAELAAITNSAPIRDIDRRIFTDPEVVAAIDRRGVRRITWKEFQAMAAKR
jgi:chitin disaccharide deacetylase